MGSAATRWQLSRILVRDEQPADSTARLDEVPLDEVSAAPSLPGIDGTGSLDGRTGGCTGRCAAQGQLVHR